MDGRGLSEENARVGGREADGEALLRECAYVCVYRVSVRVCVYVHMRAGCAGREGE